LDWLRQNFFAKEGSYVFITGRRQKELDDAVKAVGANVSGVQGDVAKESPGSAGATMLRYAFSAFVFVESPTFQPAALLGSSFERFDGMILITKESASGELRSERTRSSGL
jgi:hypothetical protein